MYVPVGQRGQGSGTGMAQQQAVAQQGSGIAAGIRAADASLQAKKKEATRIYERAQNMMRTDLNAMAAFDVTKAGPDKAKALTAMANDISEQIREMNDPVKARALINKFRQYYNTGVARESLRDEASEEAKAMIGASGKEIDALNSGLPAGMEYDEVDVSWLANADAAWNKEYVYQDGEIYVLGPDGSLVKEDEAEFLQDTSMYQVGAHSVDVGSLVDWAQSKATKTAIGFKDGTWDESRARNYYRDNVLLEERAGKEHRLQLLTTMEDRGLTAHLTEEEKQQFRNGVNLGSEKFSEIIKKGEDEFVNRSRFDGIVGGSTKKGSGKGSGDGDTEDSNIIVGGMNITQPAAAGFADLKDPEMEKHLAAGGTMGHALNRFKKPPTIVGTYRLPDHPNTSKIHIHAVGVNEVGQRVAYILGEEVVETPNPLGPDFPPSVDSKEFWQEVKIGPDQEGVGADIYQQIYQGETAMADLVEADRSRVLDQRVRSTKDEKKPEVKEDPSKSRRERGESALERYRLLERQYNQLAMVPGSTKSREDVKSKMESLLEDETVGSYIKNRIKGMSPEEAIPSGPEKVGEDLSKESSAVIARIPDEMKDKVTSIINEALPQKIYAFETENSAGEKAIGFKNEAGEDTGEMIFFS